jgi:hypothetical protein
MRTRAGIVLIEDNNVALIERHRAGLDYFVSLVVESVRIGNMIDIF